MTPDAPDDSLMRDNASRAPTTSRIKENRGFVFVSVIVRHIGFIGGIGGHRGHRGSFIVLTLFFIGGIGGRAGLGIHERNWRLAGGLQLKNVYSGRS